ncbi:glycosyltransferase [Sphingomonas oligophenolica]|uniref:Glycosyltransferase n=2 Tax=Sphingomonas oligophenolica TaxID=301154 RepID=A0A502C6B9_9SPHN|nr:glycosyltransferase [Sphingomonas oligophenolica]
MLICDLTQSYATRGGGGISTYLREKRAYLLRETPHHLLQIVPGPEDKVTVDGRHIFAEVGADPVRGSPNYRFILRTRIVRELLARYRPDVIESLCPWVLPWTAIQHRRVFPGTALVAGYRTDFPNAHVDRVARELLGSPGRVFYWLSLGYTEITYREFDWVYTLSEEARVTLARRNVTRTEVLPLGVDSALFSPARRDPAYRASIGLGDTTGPLLVYAGRIDNEKRADRLVALVRALPRELDAGLVMIGDGKLRVALEAEAAGLPIAFTGFVDDRAALARALASSDIYVSAMADETFGVSIIEAQASGLPVVGVDSGAMPLRVSPALGRLGPVDDIDAMSANVLDAWRGDHGTMGRAARRHVKDHFSWTRTFERLLGDIYPKALARAAARVGQRDGESRVRVDRRDVELRPNHPR